MNEFEEQGKSRWMMLVNKNQNMEVQIQNEKARGGVLCMEKSKPKVKMKINRESARTRRSIKELEIKILL
jgi:hypothetical protein